jgi:hypothetical protein
VEELSVDVEGTRITVMMPGTDFWVTYQKKFGNERLALIGSWHEPNMTTPEGIAFRTRAMQAANDKARELGWIV